MMSFDPLHAHTHMHLQKTVTRFFALKLQILRVIPHTYRFAGNAAPDVYDQVVSAGYARAWHGLPITRMYTHIVRLVVKGKSGKG